MVLVVPILILGAIIYARSRRPERPASPEVGPVGWVAGTDWGVVAPLARRNSVRLLRHPAFLSGVVLTVLVFAGGATEVPHEWLRISTLVALGLAPFGWFVIIATNLLANRPARTGADELFSSLPAPQPARTLGLLLTAVPAAAVAAVIVVAEVVVLATGDWVLTGSPEPTEIAAGIFLAIGAVAVGVSLGRYFKHPIFGTAGVIVVIFLQSRFEEPTSWPWNQEEASPVRFFAFLGTDTSSPQLLEHRPAAWHLLYLGGLVLLMVCVALARDGVPRQLQAGFAAVVVAVGIGGFMQAQPAPPERITEMIAFLEEPSAYQQCDTTERARFCYFADNAGHVTTWKARTTDLLALLPPGALPDRIEVADRVPTVVGNDNCSPVAFPATVIPRVAASIDPMVVWAKDGAIHPGTDTWACSSDSVHGYFFALQLALHAVGLPASPYGLDVRCIADTDERAAYALWLATVVTPEGEDTLRSLMDEHPDRFDFPGWNNPPMLGVEFTHKQATEAVLLLRRPRAEVQADLASNWERLSTPPASLACA